tara:strand:- start:90 stop:755 length:666 start_codon:yes stop_codon:yes gene_type:complete
MSLYSRPMPMGDIQQMLMGVPRTPSEPSSNEDSFQFDQPRYDPSVRPPTESEKNQYQPTQQMMDLARQRFNQNRFQPQPFMGQMGGMFGSPFGGMMGGYGSPFGGLGMFGMSPYGGMPNYGMFGGMMNPFMGMGGFGQRLPSGTRFPQIRKPVDRSTFVTDPTNFTGGTQPKLSTPSTQQPFQNPNPFMNPFMSGLGSMFGNMFGGGYGSNVSNTQANVAQ